MALEPELKLGMLRNLKSSLFTNSVQQFGITIEFSNELANWKVSCIASEQKWFVEMKGDIFWMALEPYLKLMMQQILSEVFVYSVQQFRFTETNWLVE